MNETIYLVADRYGVKKMTKNLPILNRGEIPIKINLIVVEEAYRSPVIEKNILIEDWRQGVDVSDVELKELTITEEEAEMIRKTRVLKMKEILESQGFVIVEKVDEQSATDPT